MISSLRRDMTYTEEQIQKVRDISIAEVMGVQKGRKVSICCPSPDHRDDTPSFLIDAENGFYCFGCGISGHGFIDFCVKVLKNSFNDVMKEYV